jgi:hypothetical protein
MIQLAKGNKFQRKKYIIGGTKKQKTLILKEHQNRFCLQFLLQSFS